MASTGKIEIEKFNGQSFELWKLKMEDLLVDKDQWIAVDMSTKPCVKIMQKTMGRSSSHPIDWGYLHPLNPYDPPPLATQSVQ